MSVLFEHNKKAYESAVAMLEETGKACIIHPTGTGKSFIGFQLAADNPDKKVLWLSPSEYIFRTQLENWHDVGGPELSNLNFLTYAKLILLSDEELHALTPQIIVLDEFHRAGAECWQNGVSRLLTLYPPTPAPSKTFPYKPSPTPPDEVFLHAGALPPSSSPSPDPYSLTPDPYCLPQATFLLGLTATNIRYLDKQRDMASELFDDNIASQMTLGEAIVRGILNPPKYVLSVFKYQQSLEKLELRVRGAKSKASRDAATEYFEKLRRALEHSTGLSEIFQKHMPDFHGKYLVFCSNAEHMDEMIDKVPEWFGGIDPAPHIYRAYAEDPSTFKAFQSFKTDNSDHLKLLFCIDMLNEGIHISDVNGVILLRPTISPIIYKQQIGRALSATKQHEEFSQNIHSAESDVAGSTGSLFCATPPAPQEGTDPSPTASCLLPTPSGGPAALPVIFDIVLNIENLYSIGSIQQEMAAAITYYQYLGQSDLIINDAFTVVDETRDCRRLFDALERSLNGTWDLMYAEAKKYYLSHGDLLIPNKYKTESGLSLGCWLNLQRRLYHGKAIGHLTDRQIQLLNNIGIVWDSYRDLAWERNYLAAKAYYEAHGDLLPPASYVTPDGIPLGQWIVTMRTCRANGQTNKVTPERIAKLDEIGMVWNSVISEQWEKNYLEAAAYYKEHGNLLVPLRYITPSGIKLGNWIGRLRQAKRGKGK